MTEPTATLTRSQLEALWQQGYELGRDHGREDAEQRHQRRLGRDYGICSAVEDVLPKPTP